MPDMQIVSNSLGSRRALFVSIALLLMLLFSHDKWSADASSVSERLALSEKVIHFDLASPLAFINPYDPSTARGGAFIVEKLLYSRLFKANRVGGLEPDLATNWTYNTTACTWTIDIREDALWHNGEVVTAREVSECLREMLRIRLPSVLPRVKRIEALSGARLEVAAHEDDPGLLGELANVQICPRPKENGGSEQDLAIGSGPFKLVYRKGDKEIGLIANNEYYGGRVTLEGIIFHFEPDSNKTWERLLIGSTDIGMRLRPEDFDRVEKYRDRLNLDWNWSGFCTVLCYNLNDPLFRDRDVREALALAIDRQTLIDRILRGHGAVVSSLFTQGSGFRSPAVKSIPYAPQRAIEILQKAGWLSKGERGTLHKDGKPFEFTLLVAAESESDRMLAKMVRLYLEDMGITVHPQVVSGRELVNRVLGKSDFQAIVGQTGLVEESRLYTLKEHWCSLGRDKAQPHCFGDKVISELVDRCSTETDPQKKKELLQELDERVALLQPLTFLYEFQDLNVVSRRISLPPEFSFQSVRIGDLWKASINPR